MIDTYELYRTIYTAFPCWECWHTSVYCERCPHYTGYKMIILSFQMIMDCNNPFI